ncbi:mechanosensitive ion channel family protein [Legionella dresdenensis]|uniref:Mechanosensitive ion channel family protein n=1 Tax=Legionella dresdenensis TaxID=450200 RepID=A0ABV8CBN7_9GAMM
MVFKTSPALNNQAIKLILPPLMGLLIIISANYFYNNYLIYLYHFENKPRLNLLVNFVSWFGFALSIYWLFIRIINKSTNYLMRTSYFSHHEITNIILPFISTVIKTVLLLIIINAVLPYLGLPEELSFLLEKASGILIISAISWILFKLINIAEQLILHYYTAKTAGELTARKMYTQILILKRIAYALLVILTLGAILMLFDNVRALGASVLTTAGVIGLLLTFTAQRSLTSLFSGLEIALTQPIKIGDAVVVENEFGTVEEINFRHVIVKLWDWRRLVLPTNYFLEKSFQNWSREQSSNLIGVVYLYADYTLPVNELRNEFKNILQNTQLWDGNVSTIQVSDLKAEVMELRILCSAKSPSVAWDLRCEVREKLVNFIVKNYPECLPSVRQKMVNV